MELHSRPGEMNKKLDNCASNSFSNNILRMTLRVCWFLVEPTLFTILASLHS